MSPTKRSCILLPFVLAAACAKGGSDTRPLSEVLITASHHMFGFKSQPGFGGFPISATVVNTDRGVIHLANDSNYTISRATGTSTPDTYALANDGELTLYVTGTGRDPTVLFLGAYSRSEVPPPADMFFTDRVQTNASPSIGLYFATKVVTAPIELEGGWHLASMHVIFDQSLLSPDSVARAAWGSVSIAAGAAGASRTISGSGFQTSSTVSFGGTIQNIVSGTQSDGSCNLTIDYQVLGTSADSRAFQAAARTDLVLGLDYEESDGEAGMAFLMRKHDVINDPADIASVEGTYRIGGYTAFVNPANPGSDAFVGVLTLTAGGAFNLDAVGHQGADFSYDGTFTLATDGGMTISINGTNETWHGMIDRDYGTVIFLDDFRETRATGVIELNLGIGIRKKLL